MDKARLFSIKDVPNLELPATADDTHQIQDLLESLRSFGFLVLTRHPLDLKLLNDCYEVSRRFFSRPQEEKDQLRYDRLDQKRYSNVGYFPFKAETAKDSSIADQKEFFHIGSASAPQPGLYADNAWPEIPDFHLRFRQIYDQLTRCGDALMRLLGRAFSLDVDYIRRLVKNGNHVLRTIHYPPIPTDDHAVWAAPHTGIQLLGFQPRASHPGLQFCLPSGEWVAPSADLENAIIVNIGEMFAFLVNGEVGATLHKVTNEVPGLPRVDSDRYAIVFFYHANPLRDLVPIGGRGQPIRAGDWLRRRFQELGLFD